MIGVSNTFSPHSYRLCKANKCEIKGYSESESESESDSICIRRRFGFPSISSKLSSDGYALSPSATVNSSSLFTILPI
ncbi:hypothetical protein AX774_g1902 [Zancudomyces culisetae]|uniref:Uncharacterized protein n=1 Tax=Zancudomyces culisetae TaxID=1213189 RepID=A0A1R1PUG4_ZANCU|nr:hypothetical protein AX774_g1902 [Zancudomyces culisetae]|eukprot:OMH84573.1 hypothetical protein AX774_g1902 [Zancudomyces culisetae]